jgi:histidine triad (HIT) family protein
MAPLFPPLPRKVKAFVIAAFCRYGTFCPHFRAKPENRCHESKLYLLQKGEIPCTKILEDQGVLAFMDIGPVVKGHTLVIPKTHHNPLMDTPPEVLHKLITAVQRVARAQKKGLEADGINVSQANGAAAGQVVPHIHFHVIPRFTTDGYHGNWIPKKYDSPAEMEAFAGRIRSALD